MPDEVKEAMHPQSQTAAVRNAVWAMPIDCGSMAVALGARLVDRKCQEATLWNDDFACCVKISNANVGGDENAADTGKVEFANRNCSRLLESCSIAMDSFVSPSQQHC